MRLSMGGFVVEVRGVDKGFKYVVGRVNVSVGLVVEGGYRWVWFNSTFMHENGSIILESSHRFRLGSFNEIFDEEGRWAGPLPYIAYVDLERPVVEVISLRFQTQNACPIYSERDLEILENVSRLLGSPIRYERVPFGEKAVIRDPWGVSVTEGAVAILYNCLVFALYSLFLNPTAPSPGYSRGGLYFGPERTVVARPIDEAWFLDVGRVWVGADGIALAEVEFQPLPPWVEERLQRFFVLALHPSVIPSPELLEGVGKLNTSETLFLKSPPGLLRGSRAVYDAYTGFLLEANISVSIPSIVQDYLTAFVYPIFAPEAYIGFYLPWPLKPVFDPSILGDLDYRVYANTTRIHVWLASVEGGLGGVEVSLPPGGDPLSPALALAALSALAGVLLVVARSGLED